MKWIGLGLIIAFQNICAMDVSQKRQIELKGLM